MASSNPLNHANLIPSSMPLPSQTHPIPTQSTPAVHATLPPPPEMQRLMDKTANKVVESQNKFEFEQLLRHKQASNPQFAFLFRGHPWNHYYEWKVTLEQQLQIQQNKAKNAIKDTSNTASLPKNRNNENTSNIINIDELHKILSELNGSNHSINSASKWIIHHKDRPKQVCDELKSYFIHKLCNNNTKDANIFDKKLYILFMINDVLHQVIKERISIDQIDALSLHLSSILLHLLPLSYNGYSSTQQQKVMSLVNLWSERSIFPISLTQQLKDSMMNNHTTNETQAPFMYASSYITAPVAIAPPPIAAHPYYLAPVAPHPAPITLPHASPFSIVPHANNLQVPKDTLHLSIGQITKIALDLRRTGGGGTYVPLPIDKVPLKKTAKSDENISNQSKFKRALDQYWKELCLIDPKRKLSQKYTSSKRSKGSSKSRRRRSYDSRSRSRSRSGSRSRSRSRSRSKSTSSSF